MNMMTTPVNKPRMTMMFGSMIRLPIMPIAATTIATNVMNLLLSTFPNLSNSYPNFFMDQRYSKRPNKLATTKPPRKTIVHKIHSLIDPAKPACLKMIAVEPTTIPISKA